MSQDFDAPQPTTPEPPKRSAPRLKIPVPPDLPLDDPEHGSPIRRLSTMVGVNFLLLLLSTMMLGYLLMRQIQGGSTAATPAEVIKASNDEVERIKAELAVMTKKMGEMPAPADPAPQIKSLDEKIADLGKSVSEMPAKLDTLSQKVEAAAKGEGFAPAPKVEEIDKKVGELAKAFEALKADATVKPAATPAASEVNAEGPAMEQAADLFKQGKFAEAKDAFTKLQSASPDDARVWYFSALANGLATRNWQGESERLVKLGVEKEKAGMPEKAKIDAAFATLTANSGKAWLDFFRKQAGR